MTRCGGQQKIDPKISQILLAEAAKGLEVEASDRGQPSATMEASLPLVLRSARTGSVQLAGQDVAASSATMVYWLHGGTGSGRLLGDHGLAAARGA